MKHSYLFLVFLILFACTKSDTDLMMLNAKKAEDSKKPAEALALYEQIVRDAPNSKQAPEALFRSAALYRTTTKDILKSAITYLSISERYPQSEFAHKGLFTAGFAFANELNNTTKAKVLYERYLSEYKDSSLVEMVRFELKNLGKSADEVLDALRDSTKTQDGSITKK
jgi:TolA-binding protein